MGLFQRKWKYINYVPYHVRKDLDNDSADSTLSGWIQPEQNSHSYETIEWAKEVEGVLGANVYVLWWRAGAKDDEKLFVYLND